MKRGKSEQETNHEAPRTPGNKLGISEGGGVVKEGVSLLVGIKESMDCMEHWVLYANSESWDPTPKTNDVL